MLKSFIGIDLLDLVVSKKGNMGWWWAKKKILFVKVLLHEILFKLCYVTISLHQLSVNTVLISLWK